MMPNFTLSLPVTEGSHGAADTGGSGLRASANMAVKKEDAEGNTRNGNVTLSRLRYTFYGSNTKWLVAKKQPHLTDTRRKLFN